ncbi:alpha-tubulin suppressor-like RCC1 family protein [Paenibacillus sp. DS2015]|uniref:RCC1 domain-containing protein n=1 Tax=Paenibacillus sp. DS2015 TaxID=3373917 RepID=UPI003D22D590
MANQRTLDGTATIETRRISAWGLAFIIMIFVMIAAPMHALAAKSETPPSKDFIQVEGGSYFTVALRNDGSVWVWGRNLFGELGLQPTVSFSRTEAPVHLSGLEDIKGISVNGSSHNLAVKSDGTVWKWGVALGYEDGKQHSMLPTQIEGVTNVVEVKALSNSGIALLKDGNVWSWERQWRIGEQEKPRKPAAVKGMTGVIQIDGSGNKGYAVKKDGTVWSWDEASLSSIYREKSEGTVPVKQSGLSNIQQVSFAEGQLLALDAKGKVWRVNQEGKVIAVNKELTIKEVVSGGRYWVLLTTSGEVFNYGETVTGKQGKVNHLPKIKTIGAGTYHNIAISENGKVWTWGHGKFNEAGGTPVSADGMLYRPQQARADVDVIINGQPLKSAFPALITETSVQIPIKDVAIMLGAKFTTVPNEGNFVGYSLEYEGRTVTFKKLETQVWEGLETFDLPDRVMSISGTVSVPYQLLEQGLGVVVSWNPQLNELKISKK